MGTADALSPVPKMQPAHGYHNHARALHSATFLLVLLFILIQVVRSREGAFEVIDTDALVPLIKPVAGNTHRDAMYLREFAERHSLTQNISWLSRRIKVVPDAPQRLPLANMAQPFAESEFQNVRWDDEGLSLDAQGAANLLSVTKSPKPGAVDASDLIFGISTSYDRLTYENDSLIKDWQRWLTNGRGSSNGATAVVTLHEASSREAWEIYEKLHGAGIDATVIPLQESVEKESRYLDMITILLDVSEALAEQGHPKRYFGLVDDDIFFPTPGQLISRLSRFDAANPYYIGLPSERSDWAVHNDTAVTHGGGAIFFTPPAALIVSHVPCRSAEGLTGNNTAWDRLLRDCVMKHTDLPFHVLPSFYSPTDALYSIQAASYDLGVSPLTLRHARSRHRFTPSPAHLVTAVCGEACFFQRFRFGDEWILVNGYSLTHYSAGFEVVPMASDAKLLGAMQYGQDADLPLGEGIVLGETGERKEVVTWKGMRNVWLFLDAGVGARGEVWQAYVKRRGGSGFMTGEVEDEDGDADHLDSVVVLVWET
ncbi:PH signal transduction protein [Colletotrichum higginsianum]|nr:PH signal transduction protein [Colletotrichum higginsianum]